MDTSIGEALRPLTGSPPAIMCFAQAITFSVPEKSPCWNPLIMAAPMFPTMKGSSPNVSPTRPHLGSRSTSILGVNAQCDPVALISLADCFPTSYKNESDQVEAKDIGEG